MKRVLEDIKNRTFKKVYLLYGEETYLVLELKNRLLAALNPGDGMNFKSLEGHDISLDEVRDFTDTMPFFAEKRVLFLSGTGLCKNSSEGFDAWIGGLPDTAVVVFTESEVDKRNRVYKKIAETGYVSELSKMSDRDYEAWVLRRIGARKLRITKEAFAKLLSVLPEDMEGARHEIDKLCDYCMEKESIEPSDVDEISVPEIQGRIFDMVDAVSRGDRKTALSLYYDLLSLREPPLRILFLAARQLNQLFLAKSAERENRSRDDIASILRVKPFIAGKIQAGARRFTMKALSDAVEKALELENAVKSGDLADTLAVEMLIFSVTESV